MLARDEVAAEQHLHELRDELAEVRMQPVDVLRPLPLGQVTLRPGEVELEVSVESILRRSHGPAVFGGKAASPRRVWRNNARRRGAMLVPWGGRRECPYP